MVISLESNEKGRVLALRRFNKRLDTVNNVIKTEVIRPLDNPTYFACSLVAYLRTRRKAGFFSEITPQLASRLAET